MAARFFYGDGSCGDALFKAAVKGDLARIKGIVNSLGFENGCRASALSFANEHRLGVLHCAASQGHLKVCKYLVEELGADPNITAAQGSCSVTEFLLSKGIPIDIDFGKGTPLFYAATAGCLYKCIPDLVKRHFKCMKLLIKAGADVNGTGTITSPLLTAAELGGHTNFIQLLLKAGADPNIPDDLGRLPIELAAINCCRKQVEMLFPLTLPIPDFPNWSIDGVISHVKLKNAKPLKRPEWRELQRGLDWYVGELVEMFNGLTVDGSTSYAVGDALGDGFDNSLMMSTNNCKRSSSTSTTAASSRKKRKSPMVRLT